MKRSNTPHPDQSIQHRDHDGPYIWVTEFDDFTLESFYDKFTKLEQSSFFGLIPIIISSYGGDVSVLMAMRDMIKSSSKPVATIALGKALSAGACLLAAGTPGLRFASKDTTIMIHEVSGGAVGKSADITEQALVMDSLNKKLLTNLARDCKIPYKKLESQIKSRKNADWTLTAADAKNHGLIDHVSVPRLVITEPQFGLLQSKPFVDPRTISNDNKRKNKPKKA